MCIFHKLSHLTPTTINDLRPETNQLVCSWSIANAQRCLYNTCHVTGWRHVLALIQLNALVTFCTNGPHYCASPRPTFTYTGWPASWAQRVVTLRSVDGLGTLIGEKRLLASCLSWNNSARTGRIFMKYDIWVFFRKYVKEVQVSLRYDNNNRYFTWRPIYSFDHISFNSSSNEKCFK